MNLLLHIRDNCLQSIASRAIAIGAMSIALGPSNVLAWQCATWSKVNELPRYRHAMAYDSTRGVTVMFGGRVTGESTSSETWEWDGKHWVLRSSSGPAAQSDPALAFDSARSVTVLFTGTETWEWNGTQWTHRGVAGPTPRQGHKMAYDSARSMVILFGGSHFVAGVGNVYDPSTWGWDGTAWSILAPSGPPPRVDHSMAFDSLRSRIVLFGGRNGTDIYDDTWEWDGRSWQQQVVSGPRPHQNHAMAFHAGRGKTVLCGGYFDGYDSATWEWDGQAWTFVEGIGPTARANHGMTYDSAREQVILFGGFDGNGPLGDTWYYGNDERGVAQWQARELRPVPHARTGNAMVFDSDRHVTVMFGGQFATPPPTVTYSSETWEWNGDFWTLHDVSAPPARTDHALAYDSARHVSVLFGGRNSDALGDTWEWDGDSWALRGTLGPSPRYGHRMAYDASRGVVVLYGGLGTNGNPPSNLTWEWDGQTWTSHQSPGPVEVAYEVLAFNPVQNVTMMHGGGCWPFGSTWKWNGTSWTSHSNSGLDERSRHAMVFDESISKPVVFGGKGPWMTYYDDTWIWHADDQSWQQVDVQGPSARAEHAMAFDSNRGVTVMFGGKYLYPSENMNETWELQFGIACADITRDGLVNVADLLAVINSWGPCPAPPESCSADISPAGGDGIVNVTDLLMVLDNWT